MKIAHLTYGLSMGGIETMLVNLANEQARAGNEVHIFVVNDLVDASLLDRLDKIVHVHLLGRRPGSPSPLPYIRLNGKLHALAPDVVHLHYIKMARLVWVPSLRRKMCATLHTMTSKAATGEIRRCGPVFAISEMVRDDVKMRFGIDVVTVYNGVKLNEIEVRNDRPFGRPIHIVQVGRLDHRVKGQDILLQAAAELQACGMEDFKIDFIGGGDSQDYLQHLARELGVADKVEFMGSLPQEYVFAHLRDYDLFVQPSRIDGFALTVAEAMAAKVPVVVSDCQGPYEVIARGRYGRTFRGEDSKDLAKAIADSVRSGYDAATAQESRDYACRNFDISATARRYEEEYRKLL